MTNLQSISQRDLTRSSVLWFSIAFILTIIPQLFLFLPMWVAILFAICYVWRVQIFRMKMSYPSGIVKFAGIAIIIFILFMTRGNFLDTEGCTILFMAIYAMKFVESRTVRDGYILGCIGFIALSSLYLFDNTAYIFVYSLVIMMTLFAAIIGLQQMGNHIYSSKTLLLNTCKILAISLPLMAILFVIFPRFPSMLPNMNQGPQDIQAQTGVSNRMEPGSIASLANSETHILWAEFSNVVPSISDLYWRSLTLDEFDGRAWRQSSDANIFRAPRYKIRNRVNEQTYNVIFDPSNQKYLATLDLSQINIEGLNRFNTIFAYGDFRFEYARNIQDKIQYSATYLPAVTLLSPVDSKTGQENLKQFLKAPDNNPQTTALVGELLKTDPTNQEFVNNILKHFAQNEFQYTMEPGLLRSSDSIDEFMFNSKLGFCEHYASATAFMLRKANIPSRIVIGYLGGAIDPSRKLVEVRGKDAHAWVEYWDGDNGWIRIDPTNVVAPSRVDLGMDELLSQLTGQQKASTWDQFKVSMINFKDLIDYRWTKMVLGYKNQSQQTLLKQLFNIDFISIFTLVKISIGLIFAFVLIQVVMFFKPWQYLSFSIKNEYFKIIELANEAYRLNLSVSTAPIELSKRLVVYLPPDEKAKVHEMTEALTQHYYAPASNLEKKKSIKGSMRKVKKILNSKIK